MFVSVYPIKDNKIVKAHLSDGSDITLSGNINVVSDAFDTRFYVLHDETNTIVSLGNIEDGIAGDILDMRMAVYYPLNYSTLTKVLEPQNIIRGSATYDRLIGHVHSAHEIEFNKMVSYGYHLNILAFSSEVIWFTIERMPQVLTIKSYTIHDKE